uniref:SCA7 domain-containing protein n=1 Tax=Schistocephalus solidus TaxID=70667 RepID=A0A0X3Q471_SCHSO
MNKLTNPWELLYCTFETSEAAATCEVQSLDYISGADGIWKQKKLPSFFHAQSNLVFCTLCQTVILHKGISEHRRRQHINLEVTQEESSVTGTTDCKHSRAHTLNPLSSSRCSLGGVSISLNPERKHPFEKSSKSKFLSTGPAPQDAFVISKYPTHNFQTPETKRCDDANPDLEAMLHECFSSLSKNLGMETTHLSSHEIVEPVDRQNACTTPEVVHQPTSNCSNSFYTNLCEDSSLMATNECNSKDHSFFDFYDFFPENPEFINKCDLEFVDGMSELKTNMTPVQEYQHFDIEATRQQDFSPLANEVRLSPCANHMNDTSPVNNNCYSKSTIEYEHTFRDQEPFSGHGKSEASDGQSHMLETPSPDFFTLLSASSSSTYSVDSNVFSGTETSSAEIKFDSSCSFQNPKSFNNEDARSPLSNMPVLVRFSNSNSGRLPGENDVEVEQAVASIMEDAVELAGADGGSVVPGDHRNNAAGKTARTRVISASQNKNTNSKCLENHRETSTMCFTPPTDEFTSDELLRHPKSSSVPSFPIMDCAFPKTCSSDSTLPLLSPVNSTSGVDSAASSSFLDTSPLKLADPVGSLGIWNSNLSDLNTAGSQNTVVGGDATDLDSDIWDSLELQNYACADADDSPDGISGLKSSDLLTGLDTFLSADSEPAMPQCDFQSSMMPLPEGQRESNQNDETLMQSATVAWDVSVTLPSAQPVKAIAPNDSKLAKAEITSGKSRRSNEGFNGSLPLHLWPFDPRLHCGVQRDGTVCRRSLLCKLHSMGLKRQVKRPQDISLLVKQLREAKRSKKTSVSKCDGGDTLMERRTTSSAFILPNISSGILAADCSRSNIEQFTLSDGTLSGARCLPGQPVTSNTNCITNLKSATLELTAQPAPAVLRCATYGNQVQVPAGLLSNGTQLRLVDASSQLVEKAVHPQTGNYPTSAAGLTVVSDSLQANSIDCKRTFLANNLSAPYLQFTTGQPSIENGIPVSSFLQNRQLCAVIGVAQRRDGQLELQQHASQPGGFVTVNGMPLSLKMYNQTATSTPAGLSATRQSHQLLDTGTDFLQQQQQQQQQPSQPPLQQQQARLPSGQLTSNNTATIIVGDRGLHQTVGTAGGAVPIGNIVQYSDDKVDSINLLSPTGATNCISLPPRSARLVQFILPQSATALSFRTHPKYTSASTSVIQLTTTPSAGMEGGTTIPLPQSKPIREDMVVQQVSQAQQQQPQTVEIFQQLGCSHSAAAAAAQPKLQEVNGGLRTASENPLATGTFTVGLQAPSQLQHQQHLRLNGQGEVMEMQTVDENQISIMNAVGESSTQRQQQQQQSQLPRSQQISFARNDVPDASSLLTLDEWEQLHKAGSIVLSASCALAYDSEKNDLTSEPEDLPDSSSVGLTMSLRSSPPALDQQEPLVDGLCGTDLASGVSNVDNIDQLAPSSSSTSADTTSATNMSVAEAQLNFTSNGDNSAARSESQRTPTSVGWLDFVNSTDLGPQFAGGEFHSDSPPQTSSEETADMTGSASKSVSVIPQTVKMPSTSASSHSKLRVLLFDMEEEGFEVGPEEQDGKAPEEACCEQNTASFNMPNCQKNNAELGLFAGKENGNRMTGVQNTADPAAVSELSHRPNESLSIASQVGKILRKRTPEDFSTLQPCSVLYSSSAGNSSIPTAIVAPTAFSLTTPTTNQSPGVGEETARSTVVVSAALTASGKLAATDKVPRLVNGLVSKLKSPLLQPTAKRRRQSPASKTNDPPLSRGDLTIRVGQESLRLSSPPAPKQKRTDDVATGIASIEVLGKSPLSNCTNGSTTVVSGKLRSSTETTPTSTTLDLHSGKVCTISNNQPASQSGILQLQQTSISLPQVPTAGGSSVILYPGCVSVNNFTTQTTSVNCQSGIPLASPHIYSPIGNAANVGPSPWNCVLKSADGDSAATSSSRVPLTLVRLPNGQLAAIPSVASSPKAQHQVAFVPQSPVSGTSSMQSQGTQGATLVLRYQQPQPKPDYALGSSHVRLPSAEQNAIAQIVAQLSASGGNQATVRSALLPLGSNVAIVNGHYQLQQQQQQQQHMLFQTQQQQPQQVVMVSGKGINNCYTGYELGNGITAIRTTSATSTTAVPTDGEVGSGASATGPGATNVVNFPTDLGQPVTSTVTALQREQEFGAHVQTATATSGYPTATANLMSPTGRQQSSPMTIMLRSVQSHNAVQFLIPQPDGTMLLQPTTSLQNTACYSRLTTHNGGLDCISLLPHQSCHVSGAGGNVGTSVQAGAVATQTTLFGQKACLAGSGSYMISPMATAVENDGGVAEPSSRTKYTFAMDDGVAAGTIFQGSTALTPAGGANTTGAAGNAHGQVCLAQPGSGMVTLSTAPPTSTAQFVNAGDCDPRGGLPIEEGIQANTAARGGGFIELVTTGPLDVEGGARSLVSAGSLPGWLSGSNKIINTDSLATTGTPANTSQHILSTIQQPCLDVSSLIKVPVSQNRAVVAGNGCGSVNTISNAGDGARSASAGSNQQPSQFLFLAPNGASVISGSAASFGNVATLVPQTTDHNRSVWTAAQNC